MPTDDASRGELRLDPLTRRWVNIVGHRQGRPNLPTEECPFCVGGREAPAAYDVRWFENRWPAWSPGAPVDVAASAAAGATTLPAVGACEVVLYSPRHDASLATLGVDGARRVVDLWTERTEALLDRPEVEYVLVFENRGPAVGATIHHPHGQVYGYPFVPPAPARELGVAREHGCPLCVEVLEEPAGPRVVRDGDGWLTYVPRAASDAYEARLTPRSHLASLPDLDESARAGLAAALVDVLGRYDRLFAGAPGADELFPYLLWVHQARGDPDAHLHLHLTSPRRGPGLARFVASSELGSGIQSNPVVPEEAAAALRDA